MNSADDVGWTGSLVDRSLDLKETAEGVNLSAMYQHAMVPEAMHTEMPSLTYLL